MGFSVVGGPREEAQGYRVKLVGSRYRGMCLSKVHISMPNNASLEGFVRKVGFTEDRIA